MKLYKYRSLQNFDFVADILCNNRFYAAQYFNLNDPMEGLFNYDPDTQQEYLDKIKEGKSKLRILSLSKVYDNLLLWAHYSDGFKGICIELEVSENSEFEVEEIDYSPFKAYFSNEEHLSLSEWPRVTLRNKNEAWEYEEEVRIFSRSQFIDRGIQVKKVLLGIRTPEVMIKVINRLAINKFPVHKTRISEFTNKVEISDQINN